MSKLKYAIGFIMLTGCSLAFGAESFRSFEDIPHQGVSRSGDCYLEIIGQIQPELPKALSARLSNLASCRPIFVRVNSLGGDMIAAMSAGRLLRSKRVFTVVSSGSECASACSLLFLGGVVRWPFGRIGLHRPYSTAYSLNQTEARKSFLAINGEVKNYLLEMNIPDTVLMVMNRIPPAEIKWLTNTEKDELQFNGSDPVHDDEIESIWAKRIGISRQEYYRRVQEGNNRCILTDGHDRDKAMIAVLECRSRILEGK